MEGFRALVLDETRLAAMQQGSRATPASVRIWSGRDADVFDFEFPTDRTQSGQVDGEVDPLYQIYLQTEAVVFPADPAHLHDHKRVIIERGADWLLDRARLLGKYSGIWAEQMFRQRGPLAIRVLHGLLSLAGQHPVADLERACQQAIHYGAWRLRDLRQLLGRSTTPQLTFLETHPLIRDLEAYDRIVPVFFASSPQTVSSPHHESREP